jgi:hypothetical protein
MMLRQSEFSMNVAVCAWCEPDERGSGLGAISHGICPRHLRKLAHELKGILPKRRARRRRDSGNEATLPLQFAGN